MPRGTREGGNARVIPGGVVLDKFQPGPLSIIDQKGLKRISIQCSALKGGTGRTTVDPR